MGIIYKNGVAYGNQPTSMDAEDITYVYDPQTSHSSGTVADELDDLSAMKSALQALTAMQAAANNGKLIGISSAAFAAIDPDDLFDAWEGGSY